MSVSIGIPIYNCAPFLEDAIKSVFAQTHQKWELLLVDDGSTDGSLEIAQAIEDPRVRVIADGVNRGLARRLNQIAEESRFPWVARMDGDDLMDPRRIEFQLEHLGNDPDLDVISTGTFSMNSDCTVYGKRGAQKYHPTLQEVMVGHSGIVHASCIYRRDWILRHRYDETYRRSEDYELLVRAAAAGDLKSLAIAEPLYVYREDLNITRRKLLASYRAETRAVAGLAIPLRAKATQMARIATKSVIVGIGFGERMRNWMQARRNPADLTAADRARFEGILSRVRAVQLPTKPGARS